MFMSGKQWTHTHVSVGRVSSDGSRLTGQLGDVRISISEEGRPSLNCSVFPVVFLDHSRLTFGAFSQLPSWNTSLLSRPGLALLLLLGFTDLCGSWVRGFGLASSEKDY